LSDYPRGLSNGFFRWLIPLFDALTVTATLPVPLSLPHRRSPGIFAELSSATIFAPPPGIPRCNSAGAPAGDETVPHIPSANTAACADAEPIASAAEALDFRDGVYHSQKGSWEVIAPRKLMSRRGLLSSPGRCKRPAQCEIKTRSQTNSVRWWFTRSARRVQDAKRPAKRRRALVETNPLRNSRSQTHRNDGKRGEAIMASPRPLQPKAPSD
jgi:hypothetical protein